MLDLKTMSRDEFTKDETHKVLDYIEKFFITKNMVKEKTDVYSNYLLYHHNKIATLRVDANEQYRGYSLAIKLTYIKFQISTVINNKIFRKLTPVHLSNIDEKLAEVLELYNQSIVKATVELKKKESLTNELRLTLEELGCQVGTVTEREAVLFARNSISFRVNLDRQDGIYHILITTSNKKNIKSIYDALEEKRIE